MKLLDSILHFPTRLFLIIIGLILFVPFIGSVHLFDWDEINFAESAREMIVTGNYRMVQINFEPFYEKPPFFIWLQVFSMKYFGINEFAARLPNAICGIATLMTVSSIGRKLYNGRFGAYWALLFACSILPQLYFKSGIIDPVFNYLIFSGIYFLFRISMPDEFESYKTRRKTRRFYLMVSAGAVGLAILTKGPVALGLVILTITAFMIWNRGKLSLGTKDFIAWTLIIVAIITAWLSFEVRANGLKFLDEFVAYQIRLFSTPDSGHGGPFYYHFLVLLIGCFPASILAIAGLRKDSSDDYRQRAFKRWMIVLLVVVLVVFSVVKTKIIHYSSLAYFPLTFLGAYYIEKVYTNRLKFSWWVIAPITLIGGLLAAAAILLPIIGANPDIIPAALLKDPMAKSSLGASVIWKRYDIWIGCVLAAGLALMLITHFMGRIRMPFIALLLGTCIFTNAVYIHFVPRIERYSQGAMIDFIKQKRIEKKRIDPMGFKSYAHLFYGKQSAAVRKEPFHYIITKEQKLAEVNTWVYAHEVGRKNGFVFLECY